MDLIAKVLRNYSITVAIMLAIVCVVGFVIYVKKNKSKEEIQIDIVKKSWIYIYKKH